MCDLAANHEGYGFLVDHPAVRELIAETQRLAAEEPDVQRRVERLRPSFARLLEGDGWLPDAFAQPDPRSGMGGGIGQYALYRAADGSLCLFSLVIPARTRTPVHDHLAWGLVGLFRGEQEETIFRRTDDGADPERAMLEVQRRQHLRRGQFYTLLPPRDDIHYVETVSDAPSVSIHLLANDTACVWRHRFEPETGHVVPFRSGYSNAPCREETS